MEKKRPRLLTTQTLGSLSLSYIVRLVLEAPSWPLQKSPLKVVDGWATPGVKPQVHNITDLLLIFLFGFYFLWLVSFAN